MGDLGKDPFYDMDSDLDFAGGPSDSDAPAGVGHLGGPGQPGDSQAAGSPQADRVASVRARARKGKGAGQTGIGRGQGGKGPASQQPVEGDHGAARLGNAAVEAERLIAGAVMANQDLFETVNEQLRPDDFFGFEARAVWGAIVESMEGMLEDVPAPDPILLAALPRVIAVTDVDTLLAWRQAGAAVAELEPYIDLVRKASQDRLLREQVLRAQEILGEEVEVGDKANQIKDLIGAVPEARQHTSTTMGAAAISALAEMAQKAQSGQSGMGIPFGFSDLDEMTAGMHPGNLIVVAARPSMGKTAFALNVGGNVASQGIPTEIASMEMTAQELAKRELSIRSGVDGQAIRTLALDEADWDRLVATAEEINALPYTVMDVTDLDLHAVCSKARKLHKAGKLGLLIIDYLQIMRTSGTKGQNREQQIGEITRGLKALAMQLGIPVILLSQLSREVEKRADKKPILADLRESGSIEQDADVVLFLYREEVYDKHTPNKGLATVIIGKQRAGPVGEVVLKYKKANTKFENRSTDEIAAASAAYRGGSHA